MNIHIYKIANPISCIKEIIILQSDLPSDTLTHIVPPFGYPEIIFYLGKPHQIKNVPCEKGFIKGQYTAVQKIDFEENYHFISVRLQPYGLKRLFNMDASELQNAVLALEEHPTSELIGNFINNQTNIDAHFLKEFVGFIDQLAIYPVSHSTLGFVQLINQSDVKTIKSSIAEKGIGVRTLQRNFKKEVGLTPKEFLKISRMSMIEQQLAKHATIFQIVADFDFTDQAHFVKEFKQLRNHTLTDFKRKRLFLQDQLGIPDMKTL